MIETLLLAMLAINPGCVPEDREALTWGTHGQSIVEVGPVPRGSMWLVRAAGGSTNVTLAKVEYMMEVVRPVKAQGSVCCWRMPVVKSQATSTTPLVALSRPLVMHEGESLSVRAAGVPNGKIAALAIYYELPRNCLLP